MIKYILTAVLLVVFSCPVFAGEDGTKGASEKAYEHANEKAKFKREEGWFDKVKENKKSDRDGTDSETKDKEEKKDKAEKKVKKEKGKAEKAAKKSKNKAEDSAKTGNKTKSKNESKEKIEKEKGKNK